MITVAKSAVIVIIDVLVVTLSSAAIYNFGVKHGINKYHETCFYGPPGVIVDEEKGSVVQCNGLGTIPKNEIPFNQQKKVG